MNPHLVTTSALFAPFGRLLRKLHMRSVADSRLVQSVRRQPAMSVGELPSPSRWVTAPVTAISGTRCLHQPLRVVRVMEAGQTSALTGRILMSGRMDDVCAELDRMVEREEAIGSAA